MKKYIPAIFVSLVCCLFIYVFYRTEKTVVNQYVINLFSLERYAEAKSAVTTILPLQEYLVYSLPEGLWIFCITITSSFFYIKIGNRRWSLVYLPLAIAVVMEMFQLFHFTNGRFDMMDIAFAFVFWLLAFWWTQKNESRQALFDSIDVKSIGCMISYSIVYLAHVN